jgi:hypothetical protein
MDQKKLIKAALGRIKGLAKSSTAALHKKRLDGKKAPPPKVEPVAAVEDVDEPEAEDVEAETEEAEPEDLAKKTTLVTVTRGRSKPDTVASKTAAVGGKRKGGRSPKVKA